MSTVEDWNYQPMEYEDNKEIYESKPITMHEINEWCDKFLKKRE